MNAPKFNTHNLPTSWGSVTWMKAVVAEEQRCCAGIDARLNKIQEEFFALGEEFSALEKLPCDGLFTSLARWWKMNKIERQMNWRRSVIIKLLDAQAARIYG